MFWELMIGPPLQSRKGGGIGLITEEGEIILPPKVHEISQLMTKMPQKVDLFVARLNDKWGIIAADGTGKWIVEPVYDYIAYPNNLTKVEKDGKYGVLDISKNEFLIPFECDKIWEDMGFIFTNGIGYYEKDGKTGVITESGRFTEAIFEDVDGEPEGLVKVKYNGEWGFIGEDNGFTEREEEAAYIYYLE